MTVRPFQRMLPALALLAVWSAPALGAKSLYGYDELAQLGWPDLECIYRQAQPGHCPDGFARGRVVYRAGTCGVRLKSGASQLLWHGKHFNADQGTLVNQWLGVRAIHAKVAPGTSWLDGKPALVLDYSETSRLWGDVRDEMREVAPGVYVGAMYRRRCPEPQLKLYFILTTCPQNGGCQ